MYLARGVSHGEADTAVRTVRSGEGGGGGVPAIVVVVVLTLTHRLKAVRGHRTGSNSSGGEDYLRRKKP